MHNGYSSLFSRMSANILAGFLLLISAVACFFNGFAWWPVLIGFVPALFFLVAEKNSIVRRSSFNILLIGVVLLVSWLLFRVIFPWKFFKIVNWVIVGLSTLFLLFATACAFNGKRVDIPFCKRLADSVCGD